MVQGLDLCSLASTRTEFETANEPLWFENRHFFEEDIEVDEGFRRSAFNRHRLEFLQGLARQPRIFPSGFDDLEESARANIRAFEQEHAESRGILAP